MTDHPPVTQAAQLAWVESILRPPAAAPPHDEPTEETSEWRGRAYAEQALHEIETELALTREGERNERLAEGLPLRLATMAGRGWLAEAEIRNALRRACELNGLIGDDGAPAFQRTLDSGLTRWPAGPARRPEGSRAVHPPRGARRQRQGRHQGRPQEFFCGSRTAAQHRRLGRPGLLDPRRPSRRSAGFPMRDIAGALAAMPRTGAAHGAGVTAGHVAVPVIATAAGLVGTAIRVRASRSWSEPLTLWSALIGFSGTGKTPGIDVPKRALAMIERSRKERVLELQRQHDTRAETAKAERAQWKKQVDEAVAAGRPPPAMPATAVEPGASAPPRRLRRRP